jgi:uncharacterized membrane protein
MKPIKIDDLINQRSFTMNRRMKKAADEKFKQALRAAMQMDEEKLEEELKNMPPHQFSPEFEAKMEELLEKRRRKIAAPKMISILLFISIILLLFLLCKLFFV